MKRTNEIKDPNQGWFKRIKTESSGQKVMSALEFREYSATEENLQIAVCNYLRAQYPDVLFTCDIASGMKMTVGQAVKAQKMRSNRGMPDIMIFESRFDYCGLFIELKRETEKIYLKDGVTLVSDKHTREQHQILNKLKLKGYLAEFAIGFDEAKKLIDNYLKT